MRGILSLFSRNGKHRKKQLKAEDVFSLPPPEIRPDLPSIPEPDRRTEETAPKKTGGSKDGDAGPIRRITESIRDLAVRAEETVREVTAAVSGMGSAGNEEHIREPRISSSVPPEDAFASEAQTSFPAEREEEERPTLSPDLRKTQDAAARLGPDELSAVPEFRAEVREEDIPYRRGGFTDETAEGCQEQLPQESIRLLLDRTKEMEEKLSRLNETADVIRKELTI